MGSGLVDRAVLGVGFSLVAGRIGLEVDVKVR